MLELKIQMFAEGEDPVPTPEPKPEPKDDLPTPEGGKFNPNEALRKLSKEYQVNLFENGGVDALIEKITAKDTQIGTLNVKVDEFVEKEKTFNAQKEEDQVRIDVLRSGLDESKLEEIVALAKVNGATISEGLKVVKEKYSNIFGVTTQIGQQHNDNNGNTPKPKSEQERYLENSKAYQSWAKQNQKN